ncbi:hypothetical protein ACFYUV_16450 [Nonomuraea sp. NPDC003560]|uniref:hypothetical protein n=1 Tax=Nonomuraea sp. NPDC003560 TaxID=3364341 RepID=UPI00368247B6
MRTWSDSPFEAVTPIEEVAERGAVIAAENGESEIVYECAAHPGWLVKLYRPGHAAAAGGAAGVLARLIALPAGMPAADRALIDRSVSWPVTRVVDGGRTAGVVIARAPAEFSVPMRMISGSTTVRLLEVDHLVQADPGFFARRGWETPGPAERLAVARNLAAVGALLERHDVVYGDWSYANAFWTRRSGRVFVIDVDSCGLTDRPWVESKMWDDPRVAPGDRLTVRTDRYKLAVLVVRCLTGVRGPDPEAAHAALPSAVRDGPLGRALHRSLTAADPAGRPAVADLLALLETARPDEFVRIPVPRPPLGPAAGVPHDRHASPADRTAAPADRSASPADRTAAPADRSASPADRTAAPVDRSASRADRAAAAPAGRAARPEPRPADAAPSEDRRGASPGGVLSPGRLLPVVIVVCLAVLVLLAGAGLVASLFA